MEITKEELMKINDRIGDNNENGTKFMYSCSRTNNSTATSVIHSVLILTIVIIVGYYIYSNFPKIKLFAGNNEISKLLISLMLLSNVKILNNSLVNNVILPLVKPLLPLIHCNLSLGDINIGNLFGDLVVFSINLLFVYFISMSISR